MSFKAKIIKIGNSRGIRIPKKVITSYQLGDILEVKVITFGAKEEEKSNNVITNKPNVYTKDKKVITSAAEKEKVITFAKKEIKKIAPFKSKRKTKPFLCPKHKVNRLTCGCN